MGAGGICSDRHSHSHRPTDNHTLTLPDRHSYIHIWTDTLTCRATRFLYIHTFVSVN